jgi:alkylhydroperoxidase family enzyme
MRIKPVKYEEAAPEIQAEFDSQVAHNGRITNMKRTLLNSLPAYQALMEWYPMRDRVQPFLGERLTVLFAHAISAQTDCLICSTFFRRLLIGAGENPDQLELNAEEATVIAFGRQLVKDPNAVDDQLYGKLAALYTPAQIVDLTVFGAMMIATNVFNNALRVDLDDYLEPYRLPSVAAS